MLFYVLFYVLLCVILNVLFIGGEVEVKRGGASEKKKTIRNRK